MTTAGMDQAEVQRILVERAQKLARPSVRVTRQASESILVIELAGERFGLALKNIREIVALRPWTFLPGAPALLLGAVNVRGAVLPVVNLAALLGRAVERNAPSATARLLVLGQEDEELAVLVDQVDEIRTLATNAILRTDDGGRGDGLVSGTTRDGLVILDGARLLQDARLEGESDFEPASVPDPRE